MLGIFNIGPFELLLLVAAAVLLFGGDLPQNARKAGRMLAKLRATASELGRAIYDADEPTGLPPRLPPGRREPPAEVLPADRSATPTPVQPPPPGAAEPSEGAEPTPPADDAPRA